MSITKDILRILVKGLVESGEAKRLPYKMIWGDLSERYDREAARMALKRAVDKRLVKKTIKEEQVYIALTNLGKNKFDKYLNKESLLVIPKGPWDGKYRFIAFDIPEKNRLIRDEIRKMLKSIGCIGIQKSLWVTKRDISETIKRFIQQNDLGDHVLFIESENLNNKKLDGLIDLEEKKYK